MQVLVTVMTLPFRPVSTSDLFLTIQEAAFDLAASETRKENFKMNDQH